MSFQAHEAIERKKAWEASSAGILAKALVQVARTHHGTARLTVQGGGYHLAEQHWQYCRASSCTLAFTAMVRAKVPGYQAKVAIRRRRIEQQDKRIMKGGTAMTLDELRSRLLAIGHKAGSEVGKPGIDPVTEAILADIEIELSELENDLEDLTL